MGIKGKYPSWGNFLKSRRETRFKSARELCRLMSVGISYPQYSRYEAGDQLPSLEQALSIGEILGVPPIETTIEWTVAQLPASQELTQGELTRMLDGRRGGGAKPATAPQSSHEKRLGQGLALDDVIVFNRSHLKVFGSDPAYRDVFTYVNSFGPDWIESEEIARALGLDSARVAALIEQLSELGVIHASEGKCRSTKRVLYYPDDEDFFTLRNFNFRHNAERILESLSHRDVASRKAYRGLVTRELTAEQAARLMASLEQVLSQAVAMPETPEARSVYSLCVLFGERFAKAEAAMAAEGAFQPGLARSATAPSIQPLQSQPQSHPQSRSEIS
jgi:transcriptional regulator with XRE-family HTH domain/DNA-binding MarR family transcriptional regulator